MALPNPPRASIPWALLEALVERGLIVRGDDHEFVLADAAEPVAPSQLAGIREAHRLLTEEGQDRDADAADILAGLLPAASLVAPPQDEQTWLDTHANRN